MRKTEHKTMIKSICSRLCFITHQDYILACLTLQATISLSAETTNKWGVRKVAERFLFFVPKAASRLTQRGRPKVNFPPWRRPPAFLRCRHQLSPGSLHFQAGWEVPTSRITSLHPLLTSHLPNTARHSSLLLPLHGSSTGTLVIHRKNNTVGSRQSTGGVAKSPQSYSCSAQLRLSFLG